MVTSTTIGHLTQQVIAFRDERNWEQFHNPKDVALSLVLEAAELLEYFQWKSGDELSDVLYWVLLLAYV